ncbi:MAG: hypothetical protein ACRDOI_39590 [Trebonia sp.]
MLGGGSARLGGRPFLRVASVAALGVTCLAVAACSGPPDPLASLTGNQVLTEAVANFKVARSLTMDGLVDQSGTNLVLRVGIVPGRGCTGIIGNHAKGDIKFVETGETLYLKPDNTWWTTVAGAGAGATGISQLIDGRYLKAPISGRSAQATACDVAQAVGTGGTAGTVAKGQVTTFDGIRVLALNDRRGDLVYVTDTRKPEITRVVEPKPDSQGYSGQLTVNVGARVTLAVPSSRQAVDASDFGVTANTGAPDPSADLSDTILTRAYANLKATSSLTMAGSGSGSGQDFSIDLGVKAGQGCSGSVGYGAKGSFKLIVIGSTVYFKPDTAFWQNSAGANATSVINLVDGRYIEGSASDSHLKGIVEACGFYQAVGPSNPIAGITTAAEVTPPVGGITIGRVSTLDGLRVLPLSDSSGGVTYVSDTGRLEVVKVSQDRAGGDGSYGTFTFKVGVPVTLAAPPASQVLEGSTLGL